MQREKVPILDWLGYKIRGVREPFELDSFRRCLWYRPMDGEPWDLIAYRFYGDEELWYVIADVNGITDPFIFPKSTERIAIPELY